MRAPRVSERIKEAPAQALRGVFAGIGQLLLVTDKLRNKIPAGQHAPRTRTPGAAATVADTTVTSPARQRGEPAAPPARPAAEPAVAAPGTAEAVTTDAIAAEAVTERPATAKTAPTRRAPAKPATTSRAPAPAEPAAAEPPQPPNRQGTRDLDKTGNVRLLGMDAGAAPDAAPPLPNYDELSVASLRARLRNLDIAQVRQLADYERTHAARADVLGMFERRIAKLEAEA